MKLSLHTLPLALCISLFLNPVSYSAINAAELIPDDVRYMLEDLYGANKNEWPSPRYKKDLNNDGFFDWVAKKKSCKLKEHCPAEIFICLPDKTGKCVEYCYIEVKTLVNIENNIHKMKCESTC
jgi:hypothetical protein